jgi:hypothetical protein
MMYPYEMNRLNTLLLLLRNYQYLIRIITDNKNITVPDNFKECEIIHYPNRNSLAIQGHPELDTYHHEYKEIT